MRRIRKMATRFTKDEWRQQVLNYYSSRCLLLCSEEPTWWKHNIRRESNMELTQLGFERFKNAGVEFRKYICPISSWNGNLVLGLSRIPTPFYMSMEDRKEYHFYINDDEYEMMLILLDKDLESFCQHFLKERHNEIVQ